MLSPHYRDVLFWLFVALCVVAQLGILRPLVAPRAAPEARPGVPATRPVIEVLWTVVPAIGLALLLAFTWRAMHPADSANRAVPAASVLADDALSPGR